MSGAIFWLVLGLPFIVGAAGWMIGWPIGVLMNWLRVRAHREAPLCAHCGYDRGGTREPHRCPECGLRPRAAAMCMPRNARLFDGLRRAIVMPTLAIIAVLLAGIGATAGVLLGLILLAFGGTAWAWWIQNVDQAPNPQRTRAFLTTYACGAAPVIVGVLLLGAMNTGGPPLLTCIGLVPAHLAGVGLGGWGYAGHEIVLRRRWRAITARRLSAVAAARGVAV